jgi:hypothetical protein
MTGWENSVVGRFESTVKSQMAIRNRESGLENGR